MSGGCPSQEERESADALRLRTRQELGGGDCQTRVRGMGGRQQVRRMSATGLNPDSVFDEFFVLFTAISLVPRAVPGRL